MNYEIVNLEEKRVVGLAARTNNQSPEMGAVIGGLWEKFYGEGVYAQIENKTSDKVLGIYTDYAGGAMDDYTIMVACEAAESETMPKRYHRQNHSSRQIRQVRRQGRYAYRSSKTAGWKYGPWTCPALSSATLKSIRMTAWTVTPKSISTSD